VVCFGGAGKEKVNGIKPLQPAWRQGGKEMWKRVLVTGGAGFIGSHLVDALLMQGIQVVSLDNFDEFYPKAEKQANVARQLEQTNFRLVSSDIRDKAAMQQVFSQFRPQAVVHLAAKAGVRASLEDPEGYESVNVSGTRIVLEACRQFAVDKVVFGSSSSVYGRNEKTPFAETDALLNPASPYAASKIAGEALCQTYAHLYGLSVSILRFFTVYGPRQRPDLAIRKFSEIMLSGRSIVLFGDGTSSRDYTYVADTVAGILAALQYRHDGAEVYNIGNSTPISLRQLVSMLEETFAVQARIKWTADQPGDVPVTYAAIDKAARQLDYQPRTSLQQGLTVFRDWLLQKGRG
jgi:UDP-glucuronate 4-epimerase